MRRLSTEQNREWEEEREKERGGRKRKWEVGKAKGNWTPEREREREREKERTDKSGNESSTDDEWRQKYFPACRYPDQTNRPLSIRRQKDGKSFSAPVCANRIEVCWILEAKSFAAFAARRCGMFLFVGVCWRGSSGRGRTVNENCLCVCLVTGSSIGCSQNKRQAVCTSALTSLLRFQLLVIINFPALLLFACLLACLTVSQSVQINY